MTYISKVLLVGVCVLGFAGIARADAADDLFQRMTEYRGGDGGWIRDSLADQVAYNHSWNMCQQDTLSHFLDGKGPGDRLTDIGISWVSYAENIAYNTTGDGDDAFDRWERSAGHRTNMANRQYTRVGVGSFYCYNPDDPDQSKTYFTAVFYQP